MGKTNLVNVGGKLMQEIKKHEIVVCESRKNCKIKEECEHYMPHNRYEYGWDCFEKDECEDNRETRCRRVKLFCD